MPATFAVDLRPTRGVDVLHLVGDLDLSSARVLLEEARQLLGGAGGSDERADPSAARSASPGRSDDRSDDRSDGPADDLSDDRSLRAAPAPALRSRHVVVDVSQVPFTDSSGLGALLGVYRLLRERGCEVAVAGPNPELRHLLTSTGVPAVLPVHATLQEALAPWT